MVGLNTIGGKERFHQREQDPDPQRYDIEKIIQHPEWNLAEFYKGNDIALVRVKGLIKLYVSLSSWNYYILGTPASRVPRRFARALQA